MTIGAVSFQPYVYNVNAISPASMNRLTRISDNVLDKKTDYSGLVGNENPLKKGQTLNFQDMLEMQMQRGRSNAARVMKPTDEAQEETGALQGTEQEESALEKFDRKQTTKDVQHESEAFSANVLTDAQMAAFDGNGAGSGISSFRMQQAISAYEMFATA